METLIKKTLRVIDNVNDWIGKIVSFLILGIIFIMVYDTLARYIFASPTIWGNDIVWLISSVYFLLAGGYVLRHKRHVSMDVVYNYLALRTRAILDLFTASLFFAFCYVLLRDGGSFAWLSLMVGEKTMPPSLLPIYPSKMALPISAFLLGIQGLAKFISDFIIAIYGVKHEY